MRRVILLIAGTLMLFCGRTSSQADVKAVSYWNGWYEKGHKVGYVQVLMQTFPDRYRFERRGRMMTVMMGDAVVATPISVVNTDRSFAMRDFDFTMSTTGHEYHVMGVVRGDKVMMTVESGGQRQSLNLEVTGPVYPTEALPSMIRSRALEPKLKYEVTVFDVMIQKTSNAEITVLGDDRITLRDTVRSALKVSAVLFDVPHTVWIDSNGVVLREEAPPSSAMVLEPPDVAMSTRATAAPADLMSMFAVPVTPPLSNPRQLRYLKLELNGIDARKFDLNDETQRVLNSAPVVLEVAPSDSGIRRLSLPITGDTTALNATLAIQSRSPLIIKKARELAGGSTDAEAVARQLNNWVFTNVRPRGTPSMPSATDVLQTMEGDCNEHAVLYAAFCRALGIPCKVCVGLVYRDNYFWYHAWNKVYLGRWVPVDPTFGQFPVDATHLKLKEGEMDEQAQVLTVVGNLSVKVLATK